MHLEQNREYEQKAFQGAGERSSQGLDRMNKPLRVLALCVVIFCFVPALSAASPSLPPVPFYFLEDPIKYGPSGFSPQSTDFIVRPPIPSTPDIITGEQEAVPLHDDSMHFAFDFEVRPPPDGEEYIYKQNDMAGPPKFRIGYGFVPLPPGPSMPVPVDGLNATIPITIWNETADWSGTPLPSNTSEITPSIEKFLTFTYGPGTGQIIAEEPDDGMNPEEEIDSECTSFHCQLSRLFPGRDMEYRPGLTLEESDPPAKI
jgi:hypothetical protein